MKKGLWLFCSFLKKPLLTMLLFAVSACAQSPREGLLIFKTLGIRKIDESSTYNVPIFQSNHDTDAIGGMANEVHNGVGAGTLPGGVTIGLFTAGSTTPLITSRLGTTPITAPFAVAPASDTVAVPGTPPGSVAVMTVRVWQGASFEAAQTTVGQQWREWTFTTRPLTDVYPYVSNLIVPPTMTGWGPEDGSGYELNVTVPEPSIVASGLAGVGTLLLLPVIARKSLTGRT